MLKEKCSQRDDIWNEGRRVFKTLTQDTVESKDDCNRCEVAKCEQVLLSSQRDGSQYQRITWGSGKVENEVEYRMNAKISWQCSEVQGNIFAVKRQHIKD